MRISRRRFGVGAGAALSALGLAWTGLALASAGAVVRPVRVLIVDGVNNHDWKTATLKITEILALHPGTFTVDVSTTPPRDAEANAWEAWRPAFAQYDVVVINWNGGDSAKGLQWPAEVETAFAAYVLGGGGMVSFHAGNNAFAPWKAYNEMIGLGWRPATFGPGIQIADDDSVVMIPQGTGHGPGHPANLDFQIHVRHTGHPIVEGMPPVWMHPLEQLTHGQHGPAEGLTVLTSARSPVTHLNEPMDWVRTYGKGRVYTTMLGHTWLGESCPNLDCVGLQTLLARGVQWAAVGRVNIPIPTDFPGPEKSSLRRLP